MILKILFYRVFLRTSEILEPWKNTVKSFVVKLLFVFLFPQQPITGIWALLIFVHVKYLHRKYFYRVMLKVKFINFGSLQIKALFVN